MEVEDEGLEDFETYQRVHPRLVVSLLWVAGDPDSARDAVDEACARALVRCGRVSEMESPVERGELGLVLGELTEHRLEFNITPLAVALMPARGDTTEQLALLTQHADDNDEIACRLRRPRRESGMKLRSRRSIAGIEL